MRFDGTEGFVRLDSAGYSSSAGMIGVSCDRFGMGFTQPLVWSAVDHGWCAQTPSLILKVWNSAMGIRLEVENHTDSAFKLKDIYIRFSPESFSPVPDARKHVQYVNPIAPVLGNGVYRVNQERLTRTDRQSYGLTVFSNRTSGDSLLLGVVGSGPCITSFRNLHEDTAKDSGFGIEINCEFSCMLNPGRSISTPDIVALSGDDPLALLCQYGNLWNEAAVPSFRPRITGWNSWDFYAGTVREQDILENQSVSSRDYPAVEYMVVDDGWQETWGEWEAKRRFPDGLTGFCEKVRNGGHVPGVWVAPYTMSLAAPFSRYNQDCFVRDEDGNPCMETYSCGPVVLLDPTHPKVKKYIGDVFSSLADAGFGYFKIDFTHALLGEHAVGFHDDTAGRMEIMREALRLIRNAVGKDKHISCGCMPLEALVGVVDSARIGSDIHNYWGHIKRSAMQTASVFWTHGRLWNNDPDFLIVRSDNTSSDVYLNRPTPGRPVDPAYPWLDGRPADEDELITWANVVLLSAGDFVLSDNLATLNARGREIICTAMAERLDEPAVPVDLFDSPGNPPSIWLGEKPGQKVLGLFNWEDDARKLEVDLKTLGITAGTALDVWAGQEVQMDDVSRIQLPAHGSKLFKLQQ